MAKQKGKVLRVSKAKVTDDDRTIYATLREEFRTLASSSSPERITRSGPGTSTR